MKKINFVVPCGYVGYSNLSGRVYNAGQWVNPFTVRLYDAKCHTVDEELKDTFQFKTRDNTRVVIRYEAIPENAKEFCHCFGVGNCGVENFKQWLNSRVAFTTAMFLSKVSFYEVKANNANEAIAIISAELKKHLEEEMATEAKELPLDITFNVRKLSIEEPSY